MMHNLTEKQLAAEMNRSVVLSAEQINQNNQIINSNAAAMDILTRSMNDNKHS
jgi:hypothetical protein